MPVFRGVTELALDAKGRFAIPSRHRDAIVAESGAHLVAHRRPVALPAALSARRVGADPGAPDGALVVRRARCAACSACWSATPTTSRSTPRDASWCRPRCVATQRSTSASCSSGQGRKFELWDDAAWAARTAQAIAFAAADCRRGSTASRSDARCDPCHRPPRRSGRGAGAVAPTAPTSTGRSAAAATRARILARLCAGGRLVAIDRDPAAARAARVDRDPRFAFRRAWFSELDAVLDALGDRARRRRAARPRHQLAADRRLRRAASRSGTTVRSTCAWIRRAASRRPRSSPARAVRELTEVIRDYGEERLAQSIARAIVAARAVEPIGTTRAAGRDRGRSRRRAHAG